MSDDVLLDTASMNEYRAKLKQWAEVVCSMDLEGVFGVQARRLGKAGMGIYLCKQDDND